MERNNWIIIGLVIALLVVFAVMMQSPARMDSELTVKSDVSAVNESVFYAKLTDLNAAPIAGKDIDLSVVNDEGMVVKDASDRTDKNGNAKIHLILEKGEYKIEASFAGDDNYTASSDFQKVKIGENKVAIEESANT